MHLVSIRIKSFLCLVMHVRSRHTDNLFSNLTWLNLSQPSFFPEEISMTADYTHQDSNLMFFFPEAHEVNRFKMVEYRADHAHFFTLTLKNEQPNSRLNQALARHIDSKIHSLVIMTRNDGVTRRENVVVSKSATKEPNDYRLSIIGPNNRQTVQSKRC